MNGQQHAAPDLCEPHETNGVVTNGRSKEIHLNGHINADAHSSNGVEPMPNHISKGMNGTSEQENAEPSTKYTNGETKSHALCEDQDCLLSQAEDAGVRPYFILPISGNSDAALKLNISSIAESLPGLNTADALFTLAVRKSLFSRRAFAVVESSQLDPETTVGAFTNGKIPSSPAKRIGFVFTGQGAQWPRMGAMLFNEYGVFRRAIQYMDRVLSQLQDHPPWTLQELLLEDASTSRVHRPEVSQTLCTALQIALVALLESWGIRPEATVGHSSGKHNLP